MFASSLLILFSSSSLALAFLRSAMNCTSPRIFVFPELPRPKKPPEVAALMAGSYSRAPRHVVEVCSCHSKVPQIRA
jgi:hypothetical protein